ncbi:MAG: 3'-5' exonuclease [Oscillospiraceae bacterium]|nr:3'-5' exonuclease [Oscillospiraceae bacterium]
MRTVVFDTETTGLKPGNICQLAYILIDGDGGLLGTNLFFTVDYVEPGAENVHGFSVSMLAGLSGGRRFADHASKIADDFSSCPQWVAHNFSFDNSFLAAEYRRQGMFIKPETSFCTMRHYAPIMKLPSRKTGWRGAQPYKYPNLSELMAFVGVSEDEAMECVRNAFPATEIEPGGHDAPGDLYRYDAPSDMKRYDAPGGINRHDARFDCAATYLCYKKGAAIAHAPV